MPTYRGCDGTMLHYDVLGDPDARALIVLTGGAARHPGLDRAVLVAHSAGTRLAMAHAVQHPDEVSGLVLTTPPSAALAQGPDTTSQDTFDAWQQATAPAFDARWGQVEQAHAGVGQVDLAAVRAFFSVDPPADLPERLRQVQALVLVVAGAQDHATGLAPVTALAGLFPTGRAAVIQDCGHYPWVERPAALRQAIDPFLDGLR